MLSYEEAVEKASRDEAFMATVYAMNTLLIHKGIYTKEEYRQLFAEWVEKEQRKKNRAAQSATPQPTHVQV
jgi:molybdopterin synthase catalytic subunit